jgi:hypothetical protein
VKLLIEAIDRNYVYIKCTGTRGGSELGVRLGRDVCDFSEADFENNVERIHLEGGLTLDYVTVCCLADLDLSTLEGEGRLMKLRQPAEHV